MDKAASSDGKTTKSTSRHSGSGVENEEEEEEDLSKEVQAGRGTPYKQGGKRKKKTTDSEKDEEEEPCEIDDSFSLDLGENCTSHSFCIVETMKRKGIFPVQPKGLPWASGRLLYYPGQRPKRYGTTQEELVAIDKRKKKKRKDLKKQKQRMMNKLREGDHVKLCDIMSTTQELMLLMRVITMVMERKKIERRKILAEMQTDAIPEEFENEDEIEIGGEDTEEHGEEIEEEIPNE